MNGKISVFQFYPLLFLTRLLTTLTYVPQYAEEITVSDMVFQTIFRFALGVVITFPVFYLNKKYGAEMQNHNGLFGKLKTVVFSLVFFYFAITTVTRLDLFASTVVFPETDVSILLVFVVAFCAYGAFLGLEALSRSAVMFAVPVILSLVLIFSVLVKRADFLNLSPLFYNGVWPVIKASANGMGRTVEYAVIAVALPLVKGKREKGFFIWMAVQCAITAVIFFVEGLVLGKFSEMQLFPVYTLAAMADFSFFKGLQAIITGVWVLCAFLKISLLIYLQATLLSDAFCIKKNAVITAVSVILAVICLFVAGSFKRFELIDASFFKFILILISVPILAITEIIYRGVKKCARQ